MIRRQGACNQRESQNHSDEGTGLFVVRVRSPGGGIQRVPIPDCAVTNAEAKRKAIESAYQSLTPEPLPDWTADQDLLEWLDRFCE